LRKEHEKVKFLVLDAADNVAVALEPSKQGDTALLPDGGTIPIRGNIPFAHKIATMPIKCGGPVIKYGAIIGEATCDIQPGDHAHIHNIRSLRGGRK
jgi:altronate dehydratase